MYVQDVMSYNVESCDTGETLSDAARIMWEHDCGVVPVVDAERRVVGMITDRDICMAVTLQNRLASEIKVGEVMSQPVHACTPVDDVREALEVMRRAQVRRLPVVDGQGKLAGILSQSDVLRHSDQGKSKKHVSHKEAIKTLKAVSQPHETTPEGAEVAVDDADA